MSKFLKIIVLICCGFSASTYAKEEFFHARTIIYAVRPDRESPASISQAGLKVGFDKRIELGLTATVRFSLEMEKWRAKAAYTRSSQEPLATPHILVTVVANDLNSTGEIVLDLQRKRVSIDRQIYDAPELYKMASDFILKIVGEL